MRSKLQTWDDKLFEEFEPETAHAEFSPSKFHRLVNCPWSFKYDKEKGNKPTETKDIMIGTMAHKLAAYKLLYNYTADDVKLISRHLIPEITKADFELMDKLTEDYVELVKGLVGDYSIVRVEEPLNMQDWLWDGIFGTCDCLVFNPNELNVIDLKYGLKDVPAERNEQLIAYAVGAMCAIDWRARPEKINLIIYQPRVKNKLKIWTIDYDTLIEEARRVKTGLQKIETAELDDREAGDFCEYCGNRLCPIKIERLRNLFSVDFYSEFLSDEEIIMLQGVKRDVNRLMAQLSEDVDELYEAGEILQEYQMLYTNGRKEWTDAEAVKQLLTNHNIDALVTPSPTQLLKVLTKEQVQQLHLENYIKQTKKRNGYTLN